MALIIGHVRCFVRLDSEPMVWDPCYSWVSPILRCGLTKKPESFSMAS